MEQVELLLSWQHHSGFSVDASVKVEPEDGAGLERLARYIARPPVSLERMRWGGDAKEVEYTPKREGPGGPERLDPLDFLARVLAHVPEPKLHTVHYYGHYSNVARGRRGKDAQHRLEAPASSRDEESEGLATAERQARRRAWARLIRRVYEVDPLTCTRCGGAMRVIAVILDPRVIRRILDHLSRRNDADSRAPPGGATPPLAAA